MKSQPETRAFCELLAELSHAGVTINSNQIHPPEVFRLIIQLKRLEPSVIMLKCIRELLKVQRECLVEKGLQPADTTVPETVEF